MTARLMDTSDIVYLDDDHPAHTLDMRKTGSKNPTPRPAVIWVHGGGWQGGSRQPNPNDALAQAGFVTFAISYRLSGEAVFPAQIDDVQAAIRYIRTNEDTLGVDAERLGIWGHSAGGHLAALAGLIGDRGADGVTASVQAVVPIAGLSDFRGDRTDDPAFLGNDDALHRMLDKPDRADDAFLARAELASPVAHLDGTIPPYLIIHGEADDVVNVQESRQLAEAITAAGGDARFIPIPGVDHSLEDALAWTTDGETVLDRVVAFFVEQLGPVPLA